MLGLLLLTGCTYEDEPDGRQGHATQPFSYSAAEPAPGSTGVARGTRLRVLFNLPPDGHSVSGLRVRLFTGRYEFLGKTRVDLLDQSITFTPGSLLRPSLRYLLRVSRDVSDLAGQTLGDDLILDFTTGLLERVPYPPDPPTPAGPQVMTLFNTSCARCHGGASAPMGLRLDTMAGVQESAVERSASMGGRALIRSGEHARSYLMFKLLNRGGTVGFPMPPGGPGLSTADLKLLARWIDGGANP